MGAQHEEMGTHSRVGRRFVDGVRALQQVVAPSEGEQLSGSLCGKVGAVQGHRPVCWDRFGFRYLAGAGKCSGMDCGGSYRPFDYLLAVTIRPMREMAILATVRLPLHGAEVLRLRIAPWLSSLLLLCASLAACGVSSDRCLVTTSIAPVNATADHNAAAPGNEVQFSLSSTVKWRMVDLRPREYYHQQSSLYPRAGDLPECDLPASNYQQLWHNYGKGLPVCDSRLQVNGQRLHSKRNSGCGLPVVHLVMYRARLHFEQEILVEVIVFSHADVVPGKGADC
jgi:hypothetical protein